jgi:ribosomal protein L17
MPNPDHIELVCPCCSAVLTFDVVTGTIVHHAPKTDVPKEKKLDHAMEKLVEESKKLDAKFDSALSSQKKYKDALERAFDRAHEQVKKEVEEKGGDVERPPSIFDQD